MDPRQILFFVGLTFVGYTSAANVICYYNSQSHHRQGQGKFELSFLEPALDFCSHLFYGYAGLDKDTNKLVSLDQNLDVLQGHFKDITDLKKRYRGLQIFLSVGGFQDVEGEGSERNVKYRKMLEAVDTRSSFVNSAKEMLKNYGFDGLDLAWEFPENKPKVIRGKISGWWNSFKTKIVGEDVLDETPEAHREQFTALVSELKSSFRHDGLKLSLSVLPNVNTSVYYSPEDLASNLDLVIVHAYDFYTPERNPYEADYPAPLYEQTNHKVDNNVDYQVRYWLTHSFPSDKLVLAIPTYGRAWKLTDDSGISGVPPLTTDGEAEAGPHLDKKGLYSYSEICEKTANPQNEPFGEGNHLRVVRDPRGRFGTYAYRLPSRNQEGVWVGYEDPDTVGNKAAYARTKGLAGVALVDITLDDFRMLCAGNKFPLLRAAKSRV